MNDVISNLGFHNWVLKNVEKYSPSHRSDEEGGWISTMRCARCGAECGVMIIQSDMLDEDGGAIGKDSRLRGGFERDKLRNNRP